MDVAMGTNDFILRVRILERRSLFPRHGTYPSCTRATSIVSFQAIFRETSTLLRLTATFKVAYVMRVYLFWKEYLQRKVRLVHRVKPVLRSRRWQSTETLLVPRWWVPWMSRQSWPCRCLCTKLLICRRCYMCCLLCVAGKGRRNDLFLYARGLQQSAAASSSRSGSRPQHGLPFWFIPF